MILDEAARIAKDVPFDQLSEVFEVGPPPDKYGPGNPILVYFTAKNLTGTGPFQLHIYGDVDPGGGFANEEMIIAIGSIAAAQGGFTFGLSTNIANYLKAGLSGFTGGTFDVWAGVQTY